MKSYLFITTAVALALTAIVSCKNSDIEFDDFDYDGVYFATQYPVRTIVLGRDIFDNKLDNEHKFSVFATMGGVYENNKVVNISFEVDNSLCDNLFYEDEETQVTPLPESYYTLADNKIVLDREMQGAVEVKLNDDFFIDELSLGKYYVLPLIMTDVQNASRILEGEAWPAYDVAPWCNPSAWLTKPKNYVLYGVKFINQYDGNYLRRGVDEITDGADALMVSRHESHPEYDEVIALSSESLDMVSMPLTIPVEDGGVKVPTPCQIDILFNDNNECTISTSTPDFVVEGSGSFVVEGEKDSWGNKDRDGIYLKYKLTHTPTSLEYQTIDTLVVRDRGVAPEYFAPIYRE